MDHIENIIGDYQAFFADLHKRLKGLHITINTFPLSHLLYRTETIADYTRIRDDLIRYCSEFVETQFNGRSVALLVLKMPLHLEDGFKLSIIELTAPKKDDPKPNGLEGIGIVAGKHLPNFIEKHRPILTGVNDRGQAFITFDNDKSVKFYPESIREIVLSEGWKMERLGQEVAS